MLRGRAAPPAVGARRRVAGGAARARVRARAAQRLPHRRARARPPRPLPAAVQTLDPPPGLHRPPAGLGSPLRRGSRPYVSCPSAG